MDGIRDMRTMFFVGLFIGISLAICAGESVLAAPIAKGHLIIFASNDPTDHPLSEEQRNDYVRKVQSILSTLTDRARIIKVTVRPDPYPNLATLEQQDQKFTALSNWAIRQKRLNKFDFIHFAVPPMHVNQFRYIGGLSWVCGVRARSKRFKVSQPYSISNIETENQDGAPRLNEVTLAAAHEIAHTLGAAHDNQDANIMHANMLALTVQGQDTGHYNQLALDQVSKCLSSKGY